MRFSQNLYSCLADLENRLDHAVEERLFQDWLNFTNGQFSGELFSPQRKSVSPAGIQWPQVTINTALENYESMAFQQFGVCSKALENGSGNLLSVRCNYGTGILPSLFNLEIFVMDEELNTLPTVRPLTSIDSVERLLNLGIPDLKSGYGAKVFAMGEIYAQLLDEFPGLKEHIHVYHPDLQGPLDVCELIFGSQLFFALYDRPDLVHAVLDLVCDTYTRFLQAWCAIQPLQPDGNVHWGLFHRGSIMLRDDSAMNLSASMVKEFILPYDQRLLQEFGGGAIHFCGRGDHYIVELANLEGLYAINMTQPEMNAMELIYANTIDRGINLLALDANAAQQAIARGRNLRGRVHVLE